MSTRRGPDAASPLTYPSARRSDTVDILHGTTIPDPYRWLEEPDSPETRAWVEAENRLTFGFLESIDARSSIRERLTQLWDYERYSAPVKEGGRYFFRRNSGLQNQAPIYVADTLNAEPRLLLDPNSLSSDGTVAVSDFTPSPDGTLLAYSVATAGSDWLEWRVRRVESGQDTDDLLRWSKFSGASWTRDNQGFFYGRYDEPAPGQELQQQNYYQKLCYHRVGTPQSDDILVYERPDEKEWGFSGYVTHDGRHLVVTIWKGTDPKNRVYYKDLHSPATPDLSSSPVLPLFDDGDAKYHFVGNGGSRFWFITDKDAPRGRVIAVDVGTTGAAQEIVPEGEDSLDGASIVGGRLVATYLHDASSRIRIFTLDGKEDGEIDLPGLGTAVGFDGKPDDPETFYTFTSYTTPATIYRYDISARSSEVFKQPALRFDPGRFQVKQVFYDSKDGTRVPMFIVHGKNLQLNGSNPTYLYGYGGFGNPLSPGFSPTYPTWLEMGGVLAIANLRGGGEYGEEWHQAGTKERKQNVFNDFIAAAEWLIAHGYTAPDKLAIAGGSNGGLLVGACITQRPELYGAALPAVGVMDMLRFHKFTIGWAWTSDYGSPDDPEQFRALYAYSPLHNLKPGVCYPPTLITTSDHDDRVVPAHSYKFAAALQACQACENPVLIRVEVRAGHGAGKPTSKLIDEVSDCLAFLTWALKM